VTVIKNVNQTTLASQELNSKNCDQRQSIKRKKKSDYLFLFYGQ
jgi:hypothetical protein